MALARCRLRTVGASRFAPAASQLRDHPIDQRALARAGRTRHADQIRAACFGEDRADEIGGGRTLVLDEGNRAGDRARIAGDHALGERQP